MERRNFIKGLVAGAAGLSVVRSGALWLPAGASITLDDPSTWPPAKAVDGGTYQLNPSFPCGVASGDPTSSRVTLWTRVDPALDAGSGVPVDVVVATDPSLANVVATTSSVAGANTDYTVHVDVDGLQAGSTFFYRFAAAGETSPLGRTKTAPGPGDDTGVRLGVFSCQRWTHGYYNAHLFLAGLSATPDTDLDFVVSLGDYIYETGPADDVEVPGRVDPILRAVTLEEFRAKYRLYRSDPYLQAMHAAYPVVAIFDNHDGMASPGDPQAAGALGAFWEYQPVGPESRSAAIQYRRLQWGSTLDLFMTDQRSFRDPTVRAAPGTDSVIGLSSLDNPDMLDPQRTMLGTQQLSWLLEGLTSSTATWRAIGSQLMFWPWRSQFFADERVASDPLRRNPGRYLNMTQWDGYQGERQTILDTLAAEGVERTLVLSGDSHVWSAAQVAPDWDDPDSRPVVVEFGPSSVSSANAGQQPTRYPSTNVILPLLQRANPLAMTFFKAEDHGVAIIDADSSEVSAVFVEAESVTTPGAGVRVLASFNVPAQTGTIDRVDGGGAAGSLSGAAGAGAATPVQATPRFTG